MVSSIGTEGVNASSITAGNILVTSKSSDPDQINVFAYNGDERLYPLGTKLQQNTATYRYCYVTTDAETANLGVTDSARDFTTTITALSPDKSLISGTITMVNGSGQDFVENDPRCIDGSITVNGGSTWGYIFIVSANTASANGDPITFTYTNNIDGVHEANVGDSCSFLTNDYVIKNADNTAATPNQTPIGAYTAGAVPGGKYTWVQTSGIAILKAGQSAIAKQDSLQIATDGTSAGRVSTRSGDTYMLLGRALRSTAAANEFLPVQLLLES